MRIVPRGPNIDPDADVSWEETYDLPGEWFGLCAAIDIKAHTQEGLDFLRRVRRGGTWGKATLYPTQPGEPHSAYLLDIASSSEGIRTSPWMREDKPSLYFDTMERFLGKGFTDEVRGKDLGDTLSGN